MHAFVNPSDKCTQHKGNTMSQFTRYRTAPQSSLDIGTLNWTKLKTLTLESKSEERKNTLAPFRGTYVLPQLMAWLASPAITLVRNSTGKYSVIESVKLAMDKAASGQLEFKNGVLVTRDAFIGIMNFMAKTSRSEILPVVVKRQTDLNGLRWAANVPLFLSAFKEIRNINYSEWDLMEEHLDFVFHPNIVDILVNVDSELEDFSPEDMQFFSVRGRTYKTGAKAGEVRDLTSHLPPLFNASDREDNPLVVEFEKYGKLLRQMVLQLWIFRPEYYHKYGIFSLKNPDAPAEALVSLDIFKPAEQVEKPEAIVTSNSKLPWE